MTRRKRRNHSSAFKAKVALAALKGGLAQRNPPLNRLRRRHTIDWVRQRDGVEDVGPLADVRPMLAEAADLQLFPSYYREGVPRVVREAAARRALRARLAVALCPRKPPWPATWRMASRRFGPYCRGESGLRTALTSSA